MRGAWQAHPSPERRLRVPPPVYREALSDKGKHGGRGATNTGTFFGEMTPSAPLRRSDRDASGTNARSCSFEGSDGVVRRPLRRSGHPLRRSTASGPRGLLPRSGDPPAPTARATRPRADHTRSFRENTRQHPDFTPINPPLHPREEIPEREFRHARRGRSRPSPEAPIRRRPLPDQAATRLPTPATPSPHRAREQR